MKFEDENAADAGGANDNDDPKKSKQRKEEA